MRLWRGWMFAVYPNVHVVNGTDELITNRLPLRLRVGSTSTPTPPPRVTGKRVCSAELNIPGRIGVLSF
jgi:hypothetical protein